MSVETAPARARRPRTRPVDPPAPPVLGAEAAGAAIAVPAAVPTLEPPVAADAWSMPSPRQWLLPLVGPERREATLDWALTILALLLGPLILLPYEAPLPPAVGAVLADLAWLVWGVFVVQFALRLARADGNRLRFVIRHLPDLLIIACPLLMVAAGPEIGRIWWAMAATTRGLVGLRRLFQGQGSLYLVTIGVVLVGSAANFVMLAERTNKDALITSYGDALWWTFVTMSSTGYGDKYPLTATGRTIGVGLMIVGLAIFGVFTARMAGYFVAVEESKTDAVLADLDDRLLRLEKTILASAERQKNLADKAMRIAKRTKTRQRKQTGNRKEAAGDEPANGAGPKRRGAERQAERAAAPATRATRNAAKTEKAARPDKADRKAERQADRRAERGAAAPAAAPPASVPPAEATHAPDDGEVAVPRGRPRPVVVRRVDLNERPG